MPEFRSGREGGGSVEERKCRMEEKLVGSPRLLQKFIQNVNKTRKISIKVHTHTNKWKFQVNITSVQHPA